MLLWARAQFRTARVENKSRIQRRHPSVKPTLVVVLCGTAFYSRLYRSLCWYMLVVQRGALELNWALCVTICFESRLFKGVHVMRG